MKSDDKKKKLHEACREEKKSIAGLPVRRVPFGSYISQHLHRIIRTHCLLACS